MPQLPPLPPIRKTAHIIGGGPSAGGLDFSSLYASGGLVIGVNDSYFNTPCDWVVSIDGRWMLHRWKRLAKANANAWLRVNSYQKHVGDHSWPGLLLGACDVGGEGVGEGFHLLYGNNSGLVALNFAYFLGCKQIFLYGFDMGFEDKKHWYDEYEWAAKGNHMYPAFSRQFDTVAKFLEGQGVEVFNVSPSSKLECFKRVDYGTAQNLFNGVCPS